MRNQTYNDDHLYLEKPLPANVQRELVIMAQAGSKEAQDKLVSTNLRFVRLVASRYGKSDNYEIGDLISEGSSGLIRAIYKFDTEREVSFMSYAVWWIRQAISYYIRNRTTLIRLPDGRKDDMGFSFTSLDKPADWMGDSDKSMIDCIEQETFEDAESPLEAMNARRAIEELLSEIPPEEAMVIKCRFGLNGTELTYDNITELTNIKRDRLRVLMERGISRIRKNITYSKNRKDLLQYMQSL